MIFGAVSVSPDQIAKLRAVPSLASDLLTVAQEDGSKMHHAEMLSRLPPERRQQAEARFQAMQTSPHFIEAQKEVEQARERAVALGTIESALDLEKSWHILHYVFTGDIMPVGSAGDALMTGEDLGEDTTGYGPPRLHDPESVRLFADFLQTLNSETLQSRAEYRKMSALGVYSMPMGPGAESEYEAGIKREIAGYFPLLRDYAVEAARKGDGLLMWLA